MNNNKQMYIKAEEGRLDEMESLLKKNNINYDYIGNRTVMVLYKNYEFHKMTLILIDDCVNGYWY